MHVSIDRVSQGKKTALAKLCENSTSMAFTVGFSEINLCFLCLIMIKGSVFFFFFISGIWDMVMRDIPYLF